MPSPQPSALISGLTEWATRDPDRVAIQDDSHSLTFSQLLKRVEILGARLFEIKEFIPSDKVLPILVDRRIESTVAIFGCAYAGIGFSLIDAEQPTERIVHLLDRLHAHDYLLSAVGTSPENLPDSIAVIFSDEKCDKSILPQAVSPEATALVLFTSGSTGLPKGVVFDWVGFQDGFMTQTRFPDMDLSRVRQGLVSGTHFSGGLIRRLALNIGISVYIIDPTHRTHRDLLDRINELEITVMVLPPSFIRSLGQFPENTEIFVPSVEFLSIGTEGLRYEDLVGIKRFFRDDLTIFHGYGATEASCKIESSFPLNNCPLEGQVPLGKETGPGMVWLKPGPEGLTDVQEILFGEHLAKEYLDEPELTREKFVLDDNGRRWWKSGDLVSVDDEGRYWHRGRGDDLVKIRGKLASPSEVVQVLASIDAIESSVVLPHKIGESTRFVAHLVLKVPREDNPVTARQVRRKLALSLPSHLVPASLMVREAFPLTANGKVDRVKLQSAPVIPWRDGPFIHPHTNIEMFTLKAVITVLGIEDISLDDDLWEFGLDSLAAIELVTRLEESVTTRLTIDHLLRNRTVRDISQELKSSFIAPVETLHLNEFGTMPTLFAIPGEGGVAIHFAHLATALGEDQPFMAFPAVTFAPKDYSIENESKRISRMIEEMQPTGGISLMGFSSGGVLALEISSLLVSRNRVVNLLLIDTGINRFSTDSENDSYQVAIKSPTTRLLKRLLKKTKTVKRIFTSGEFGRPLASAWEILYERYIQPKFHSILFSVSGGRYPKGLARIDFVVSQKRVEERNFVVRPVDCRVHYYSARGNPAPLVWRKIFPEMKITEVAGNHTSMLQPPNVLGLADEINTNIASFLAIQGSDVRARDSAID